ncbi:hypothetical protein [Bradyrhizobium sp.]|uniref:hypothetical protein n=1 Tax=Bradyrhizobium sp. TaxID=376 RepID=UPI002736360B|nr:hypothetical protein [Bradyrhizobium sp.]MDP3694258.1 hypothetical protein [Bradyrhizobium sp.]
MRHFIKENKTLRRLYYRAQMLRADAQSNEVRIIDDLTQGVPRTFVEFGFHPMQFNCIALAKRAEWRGLLIDGNTRQVADARAILADRIEVAERFLTLDNLGFIKDKFPQIGLLSIDVDGNDYWFLKELIDTEPSVICVEYNATFGLEPISVPYDASFDRHEKHPSGWYHGASLTALANLCATHGYGLAAVSEAGLNAFFTKSGQLVPATAWVANSIRDEWSGKTREEQWAEIKHMPFSYNP